MCKFILTMTEDKYWVDEIEVSAWLQNEKVYQILSCNAKLFESFCKYSFQSYNEDGK